MTMPRAIPDHSTKKPIDKDALKDLLRHAVEVAVDGWLVMLLLGTLHHTGAPAVPPLGYWTCVFIAWVLGGIAYTGVIAGMRRFKRGDTI